MKNLNTFEIIQNISIGAFALHKFTYSYYLNKKLSKGSSHCPKLNYLLPVLPLVYHKESLDNINSSNQLYTLAVKYPQVYTSLQDRMNKMSTQTFDSLNLAFNKKLLSYNSTNHEILIEKKPINRMYNKDIKDIFKGANKLGRWFARTPIEEVQILLKIGL